MTLRTGFVALAALGVAASASALEFTITGTAQGAWDGQAIAQTNTLFGATYVGSTFDNTTSNGFASFGGDPNPSGGNFNNFGSISLGGQSVNYNGHTFNLRITFSAPTGIAGGGQQTFTANVLGSVSSLAAGGIQINFGNNNTQTFTFSNNTLVGSFTLTLNNVAVAPGKTASVTGYVTGQAQAVPEPATLAGLGIAAVAFIRRKKRA